MLRQLSLSIASILLLSSCGSETTKDRVMEVGESYSVSKGDVIVKASPKALVKVIHVDGGKSSTVLLVEGNATITHPKTK